MTIYRGAGGSGDATNDATVTAVAAYAAQAATSATNAATSATTSGTSATNSASSASTATAKAAEAASSASQAASSQSAAATSATTAANSATSAGSQATVATNQANNAANSATAAATSASTATTKASEAATSASQAATSATNSANSAASTLAIYGNTTAMNNAVTSATNSASNAATSASQAAASASTSSDYATQANSYASAAANSASQAATSAVNAANSAGSALSIYGSATALQTAVNNAATSATQSATSATASSASSSAAQTSANSATTSATNAANSATQAAASAASAAAIVTGVASNRPSIRPSLLLDFANTKQLDPRITFSRPTTATYYDGKTVVKAEENLLTYADQFDNAAWSKLNVTVTANSSTGPDGTSTAETLTNNATNGYHGVYQSGRNVTGNYTLSVYAKAGTANFVFLRASDGTTSRNVWFNLNTGAVGTSETNVTGSIQLVGNGWYRCIGSWNTSGSNFATDPFVGISEADNSASYTGSGLNIYIWGAQLEQRSVVTAYTPTTTAAITNYIPALQTAVSNDARFDHDPVTGESKGLLIEEQRTNLLTYSSDFSNAVWSKTRITVIANTNVAPDGTLTACQITPTTENNSAHAVTSPFLSSTNSTFSIYAKVGGYSKIMLFCSASSTGYGFDLSSGTAFSVSGITPASSYSITHVGNGWYRCSMYGANTTQVNVFVLNSNSYSSFAGDGYSGIYIWGAQLEAGSFPTSYIPTVASQVTRSADSASMTGSNFSSWYRADEGTLYSEAACQRVNGSTGPMFLSSGTTNNIGQYSADQYHLYVRKNNVLQVNLDGGTYLAGQFVKNAGAYKTNDFAVSLNGASVATSSNGILPSVDTLYIGTGDQGTVPIGGTIKRIAYYPKRLSNVELQGLTS